MPQVLTRCLTSMLAVVDFGNNLTWAIFIAWIMSVVLHELGHGIVGYLGGDYTIRERGGLTLNPLHYIDPIFSLLVPAIIFLVGGIPLPGGVTYVHMELIRKRAWRSAVSAAGPAVNFLIFLACALPFHPAIGWLSTEPTNGQWSTAILFLGAFAWLQMLAVLFNLVPVPGLDGFGIIQPYLDESSREALSSPQVRRSAMLIYFLVLWQVPGLVQVFHHVIERTLVVLQFSDTEIDFFAKAFNAALFGQPA